MCVRILTPPDQKVCLQDCVKMNDCIHRHTKTIILIYESYCEQMELIIIIEYAYFAAALTVAELRLTQNALPMDDTQSVLQGYRHISVVRAGRVYRLARLVVCRGRCSHTH